MKRFVIIYILLIFQVIVLGQERFVKRAVESLESGDFAESLDQITKYLEKEPLQPYGLLLYSRWLSTRSNPFANADSAYDVMLRAERNYHSSGFKDSKEGKKDIFQLYVAFHENELTGYLDTLAKMAFEQALVVNTIENFDRYKVKYAEYTYANNAKSKAEHLRYLNVVKVDNLERYQSFVNDYPDAVDVPKANYRIHELAFVEARTKGTLEAFRQYIFKYPKSHLLDRAWNEVYTIDYNQVINSNEVVKLQNYLSSYAASPFNDEVRSKLYEVAYQKVLETNSSQACVEYRQAFPQSPYVEKCFQLEMNLKWQELIQKNDLTVQDLDQYLLDYPSSPFRDSVTMLQGNLQFEKISDSEDPYDFIGFMNEFPASDKYALAKKTAISLLVNKARALVNEDNFENAKEILDKILSLDVNHASSYYLYSHILKEQGSTSDAISKLSIAIQLEPRNAEYYAQRGLYYLDFEELDNAYQDLRKAISIDTHLPKANLGLAIIEDRRNEYSDAVVHYKKALSGGYDVSERIDYLERYIKQQRAERVARAVYTKEANTKYSSKSNTKKNLLLPKETIERLNKTKK